MMRRALFLVTMIVLVVSAGAVTQAGPEWNGFRGPNKDGAIRDSFLFERGTAGLALGWKKALGAGYSSVAVADGRVVTMFAAGESDVLAAFDPASGEELWRYPIGEAYAGHSGSHDGPISTPLAIGGRVYGLGPRGDLYAVDAANGKGLWSRNVAEEFEFKAPFYGFTTSPVLADGVLVVALGAPEGQAIAGFDPKTGELKWTVGDDGVEYQSPIVATIGGRSQVIAPGNEKLFGIDPASGKLLWSHDHGGDERGMGGRTIVPVPAGDDRFFVMTKQDASSMLKISATKDGYEVSELWANNAIKGSYVTPVYRDGFLYGISGRILTCVDATTGEIRWRSREPGDGFLTLIGDKLVVMTKPGSLHIAAASPDGYKELTKLELFDEHSWSEAAFAGGHLFARSMGHLARIDITDSAGSWNTRQAWIDRTEFGRFVNEVKSAGDKSARIDAFIGKQKSFPIVEDGGVVHFVYRGEAKDVGIVGDMIGSRREDPMTHVEGTDFFYYSALLEPNAAVTYGFLPDFGEEAVADPLNPAKASGLFGDVSWLAMPAWKEPAYVVAGPENRGGKLETIEWDYEATIKTDDEEKTEIEKRSLQVYLPHGFDAKSDRKYPTVYVHGGDDALETGQMKNALDHLIGSKIEPLIAVFIIPIEDGRRVPAEEYGKMVIEKIVPMVDGRFPTIQDAWYRAGIGAGSNGTAALTMALQNPDVFGRVGSQSAVLFGVSIGEMLKGPDEHPLTIYMDWGTYDLRSPHEAWDMAADNRKAWAAIRDAGYRPAGGELPEGHAWMSWRAHTDEMLAAMFPLRR